MARQQADVYSQVLAWVFSQKFKPGMTTVEWERTDLGKGCVALGVDIPKNLGDVVYSFRYRRPLPDAIRKTAPPNKDWVIRGNGLGKYRFDQVGLAWVQPTAGLVEIKVPDATPGIVNKYTGMDEQALLTKVRYNRLIDMFTGVACYSLQNHLRTTVKGIGQVETDEIYVGLDKRGAHYVFPLQAKGGSDIIGVVQVEQDFAVCADKYPELLCRPIAAQFISDDLIALFEFIRQDGEVRVASERHYRLVKPEQVTAADVITYRNSPM